MRDCLLRLLMACFMLAPAMLAGSAQSSAGMNDEAAQAQIAAAQKLFELANESRERAGLSPLLWDAQLADAAAKHCRRMAAEGPIAHRYPGELDLTARAGAAGGHFSLIEENIAVGSRTEIIHQGWLDSSEHRANLMNPNIDHLGISVVASGGLLFAVADFSHAVDMLTQTEVEARFAALLRAHGVMVSRDTTDARTYCMSEGRWSGPDAPSFLFRWQGPDVTELPKQVLEQVVMGRYRKGAIGSCPARDVKEAFTVYRVAVLLY